MEDGNVFSHAEIRKLARENGIKIKNRPTRILMRQLMIARIITIDTIRQRTKQLKSAEQTSNRALTPSSIGPAFLDEST